MKVLQSFSRLLSRFRHPVSLPEEVADALGIPLSNFLSVDQMLRQLTRVSPDPSRLHRFMRRAEAESVFDKALRKERFSHHSHFAYHFEGNWLEFVLQFDDQEKLRRVYLHHKDIPSLQGQEMCLKRIT